MVSFTGGGESRTGQTSQRKTLYKRVLPLFSPLSFVLRTPIFFPQVVSRGKKHRKIAYFQRHFFLKFLGFFKGFPPLMRFQTNFGHSKFLSPVKSFSFQFFSFFSKFSNSKHPPFICRCCDPPSQLPQVVVFNTVMYHYECSARERFVLRDRLRQERITIAVARPGIRLPSPGGGGRDQRFMWPMVGNEIWNVLIHNFLTHPHTPHRFIRAKSTDLFLPAGPFPYFFEPPHGSSPRGL